VPVQAGGHETRDSATHSLLPSAAFPRTTEENRARRDGPGTPTVGCCQNPLPARGILGEIPGQIPGQILRQILGKLLRKLPVEMREKIPKKLMERMFQKCMKKLMV
jgi:hypothetical protein